MENKAKPAGHVPTGRDVETETDNIRTRNMKKIINRNRRSGLVVVYVIVFRVCLVGQFKGFGNC